MFRVCKVVFNLIFLVDYVLNNSQDRCLLHVFFDCKHPIFEEIYIFGSLPSFNRFVRLRIQDVDVSSGLKVTNEIESENYSRVDYQDPISIISKTFTCINESIYIEFEENIDIEYLRIIQDDSDTYRSVKLINIDAYS